MFAADKRLLSLPLPASTFGIITNPKSKSCKASREIRFYRQLFEIYSSNPILDLSAQLLMKLHNIYLQTLRKRRSQKVLFFVFRGETGTAMIIEQSVRSSFFRARRIYRSLFFVHKIARNNKSTTSRVGERVQDRKKGISREPAHFHLPVWCALIYPKKRISSPVATVFVLTENDGEATKRIFFVPFPTMIFKFVYYSPFFLLLRSFVFAIPCFSNFWFLYIDREIIQGIFFLHFTSWTIACTTLCIAFMTFSITLWLGFRANDLQELSTLENWE